MSGIFIGHLDRAARIRDEARFLRVVERGEIAILNRIGQYQHALQGGVGLHQASEVVTGDEWRRYVAAQDLTRTYPGLCGIGVVDSVAHSDLAAYQATCRATGQTDFQVHPVVDRSQHHVVRLIEPIEGNRAVIGLDLAGEERRRSAVETARDSARITLTRPVALVQEAAPVPGLLLFAPIYAPGLPQSTVDERRRAFRGWIYAPFLASAFLDEVSTRDRQVAFVIADHEGQIVDPVYDGRKGEERRSVIRPLTRPLELAGRVWTVEWFPTADFVEEAGIAQLLLPGGFSLAVSLLVGALAWSLGRTRDRAQKLAERMTAALRSSELRFRSLVESANAGIVIADHQGIIRSWNRSAQAMFGWTADEAVGQPLTLLMPVRYQPAHRAGIERLTTTGEQRVIGRSVELTGVRKDGSEFPVELSLATWGDGAQRTFSGIISDISARTDAVRGLRASEARFRSLSDASPVGIFTTDAAGGCTYTNRAWRETSGLSEEEAAGAGWGRALHPLDRARVFADWSAASARGESYHGDFRWLRPDGSERWVTSTAVPQTDDAGTLLGYVGTTLDISDRQRAELAQREARAQLIDAIEALDAGFVMYDAEERLIICNHTYREIYDLPEAVMQPGMAYGDILRLALQRKPIPGIDIDAWIAERLNQHRNPGASREQQLADRWIRISDHRTSDGGIVSLRTDVTELKRMNEALQSAGEAAEAATRAKSDFLAAMSHEIRTPMNGVVGMTDLLLDTTLAEEQRGFAEAIRASADALLTIINDILDFSKIEAGRVELDPVDFSPRAVIEECAMLLRPRAEAKPIELVVTAAAGTPAAVRGDAVRFRQVVLNLLGNAIKFTERGEVALRLRPSLADPTRIEVAVSDTGIGMTPEQQTRLFAAFAQADATIARRFGGTGLGLTISQRLCVLMGGSIAVESNAGHGSTFTASFAFAAALAPAAGPASGAHPLPALRGRVLIAEDNPINQRITLAHCRKLGLEAVVVADGAAAVAALAAGGFDAVLMDCQMPLMDGYEASIAIRRAESGSGHPRLPIIALTANAFQADRDRCLAAGMDGYLSKPLRIAELGQALAGYLGGSGGTAPVPWRSPG